MKMNVLVVKVVRAVCAYIAGVLLVGGGVQLLKYQFSVDVGALGFLAQYLVVAPLVGVPIYVFANSRIKWVIIIVASVLVYGLGAATFYKERSLQNQADESSK